MPEWHLTSVSVTDNEKEIWSAEFGGGSTAENPIFIFDTQKIKGDLKVIAVDTQGKQYLNKPSLIN